MPLWSYRRALSIDAGGLCVRVPWLAEQIASNYLAFVPLGAGLPVVWPGAFGGRERGAPAALARVALAGVSVSLAIELAQLVLSRGYFELDDILCNALGACLGYLAHRSLACRHV